MSGFFKPKTKKGILSVLFIFIIAYATACSGSGGKGAAPSGTTMEITVSAAASLKGSLEEIAKLFNEEYPDIKIAYNFGGSGSLQQQIEQGAPVDLFISAAMEPMLALRDKGLVDPGHNRPLLLNRLVLITPKNRQTVTAVKDLSRMDVKAVAVGQPETVPAGAYAKEALRHEKLWDMIEPKAVYGKDVSQVLSYVLSGNADAGFVYASDASKSKDVRIAEEIPPSFHMPIHYPAAVIKTAKHPEEAGRFLEFLRSKEAGAIFKRHGFFLPEEAL